MGASPLRTFLIFLRLLMFHGDGFFIRYNFILYLLIFYYYQGPLLSLNAIPPCVWFLLKYHCSEVTIEKWLGLHRLCESLEVYAFFPWSPERKNAQCS